MPETVDAVVVGGGHNGLVAANLLADAGWDVVVLEGSGNVGGAVRSAEVTAPGFVSDLCSAFYPLSAASGPLRRLALESYGLTWTHAPAVLTHLLPDGRTATLSRNIDETAASVDEFAPGDGERWRAVYAEWCEIAEPLLGALLSPFPPVRAGLDAIRRLKVAGALRMARRFILPARVLGDGLFSGEGAKVLLAGLALHTDLSPDEPASGVYGWLLAMLGQQYGFPVPVGGAGRLIDALVTRLDRRGGMIFTDALVDRVVVRSGVALGVGCVDGRRYRARRAVVADVPAMTLYRHLVGADELPSRLLADLDGFVWDDATLKIDWALSAPAPWLDPAVGRAGTVHLGTDLDGLSRFATELTLGEMPTQPLLLAGQMTTADPVRSPAGTESMWVYTHLPKRDRWTADEIATHAERIEATMEKHAPGFADLVAGRHVTGPQDFEAENPSRVGGTINGGTAAAYQQLIFRPVPGLGRADTPIDRLYLASSSAHPGGAVHGAPGANAARAALVRNRPVLGRAYRAGVAAAHRAIYRT
jgi:phytoene dehydrogenase-like protein